MLSIQKVSVDDYASGNYLIQGMTPKRRAVTTWQYGRRREFGDPVPSELELTSTIKDYMAQTFNASDINILKTVTFK